MPDRTIQDVIAQIELRSQDNEGSLKSYLEAKGNEEGESENFVFQSAIDAALEQYSTHRPRAGGHVVNAQGCTVYENDFFAFCKLATAELLYAMASYYTHQGEEGSILGTVGGDHGGISDRFETRANRYVRQFTEHMKLTRVKRVSTGHAVKRIGITRQEINDRLAPDTATRLKIGYGACDEETW